MTAPQTAAYYLDVIKQAKKELKRRENVIKEAAKQQRMTEQSNLRQKEIAKRLNTKATRLPSHTHLNTTMAKTTRHFTKTKHGQRHEHHQQPHELSGIHLHCRHPNSQFLRLLNCITKKPSCPNASVANMSF